MIAAVVDPSVPVSAFIGRPDAAPGRLVRAWREDRFTMVVCPLLLDELAEVLARPKFARWAADGRGTAYVAGFAARSARRPDPTIQTATLRDPKDDYLVALARTADADLLVSIDNDLLEAPTDDLTICRPEILLQRLAGFRPRGPRSWPKPTGNRRKPRASSSAHREAKRLQTSTFRSANPGA